MNALDNLTSGEQELLALQPSTFRFLFGTFLGWLVLISIPLSFGTSAILILLIWIKNRFTKFTITSQRVKLETGIIFRRIDEIELYRVKDVKVDYSLLNQLVNIGTVSIISSDLTTRNAPLKLRYIFDARNVREMLRNLVEQSRRRRGVREVDVDPVLYSP